MTYNVFGETLNLAQSISQSYSSLDWVLSDWANFTVCRFVSVCDFVSYGIVVVLL